MNYLVDIGYYFWLIPSIISCILSGLLLGLRLLSIRQIRWIGIGEILFALADLFQCIPWLFGSIYHTTDYHKNGDNGELKNNNMNTCIVKESFFTIGLLTKCVIATIAICSLSYSFLMKKPIRITQLFPYIIGLTCYTTVTLLLNLLLQGIKVPCSNLHDNSDIYISYHQRVYLLCVFLPICLYCSINFLSFLCVLHSIYSSSSSNMTTPFNSTSSSSSTMINALMTPQKDRIIVFSLISWIGYFPALLFFIFFFMGSVHIPLYCLTGVLVSSTGILGSGYLLLAPLIDKTRKINLFFFIEKLIEENQEGSRHNSAASSSSASLDLLNTHKLSELSTIRHTDK